MPLTKKSAINGLVVCNSWHVNAFRPTVKVQPYVSRGINQSYNLQDRCKLIFLCKGCRAYFSTVYISRQFEFFKKGSIFCTPFISLKLTYQKIGIIPCRIFRWDPKCLVQFFQVENSSSIVKDLLIKIYFRLGSNEKRQLMIHKIT